MKMIIIFRTFSSDNIVTICFNRVTFLMLMKAQYSQKLAQV